jgi:hypothetical protein
MFTFLYDNNRFHITNYHDTDKSSITMFYVSDANTTDKSIIHKLKTHIKSIQNIQITVETPIENSLQVRFVLTEENEFRKKHFL